MQKVSKKAVMTAVVSLVLMGSGHASEQNCLSWQSAGPVIAASSLLPTNAVYRLVQQHVNGQIIYASLCASGARLFYKLVVLGQKGEVSNITVDAVTGRLQEGRR
jgi:hypothetical protein